MKTTRWHSCNVLKVGPDARQLWQFATGNAQVTLTVSSGILTLGNAGVVSIVGGANNSTTVTIQGTLANLNTAIKDGDELAIIPAVAGG